MNISMYNNSYIQSENYLTKSAQWGYSFLGVTLGILSVFVAPLLFKFFSPSYLKDMLVWFGLFGSGIVLVMVLNHNLIEIIEILGFDWKVATVLLSGLFTNKLFIYGFTTEDHCCELEEPCVEVCCDEIPSTHEHKCCSTNAETKVVNSETVNRGITNANVHSAKHWTISVFMGDVFCNFADGMVV